MKQSLRRLLLMCLPVVFVLAAGLFAINARERQQQKLVAYYSQPFSPEIALSHTTNIAPLGDTTLFAQARFAATGGTGSSQWLVRARMSMRTLKQRANYGTRKPKVRKADQWN